MHSITYMYTEILLQSDRDVCKYVLFVQIHRLRSLIKNCEHPAYQEVPRLQIWPQGRGGHLSCRRALRHRKSLADQMSLLEERREAKDGRWYTRQQFVEYYGSSEYQDWWNAASPTTLQGNVGLHIKTEQMWKRLDANKTHTGVWIHDEVMETGASLWNAAALRTTYARETHYWLDPAHYAKANETMGRISSLFLCGDDLQLPPVPMTIETYKQMLAVPSVDTTSRLPGMVLFHIGMQVRITTQVVPPWAVQDATGTIMGIEASAVDRRIVSSSGTYPASEMRLTERPLGVYATDGRHSAGEQRVPQTLHLLADAGAVRDDSLQPQW